jgi:hypothetical protein
MIRIVAAVAVIAAALLILTRGSDPPGSSASGELRKQNPVRACLVEPTCGMKDGQLVEYVHACAAEDAGATDIRPMRGPTCRGF